MPSYLGNCRTNLLILQLGKNKLQGGSPDTFANASSLLSFDLSGNKLEGPLPRSLANCSWKEVVNVGNNMMSDTFPCWLVSLPELKILVLKSNRFFAVPCNSETMFAFHKLRILDLSNNEYTGFLPRRFFASVESND